VVLVAVVVVPFEAWGYGSGVRSRQNMRSRQRVARKDMILKPAQMLPYATLALFFGGVFFSALAA